MVIYKITHLPSKRYYIGKTRQSFARRKRQHLSNSSNPILKNLLNKYPIDEFLFEIIEEASDDEDLAVKEQKWLDQCFDDKLCINIYKLSTGIDAKTAYKLGKQRGKSWLDQILKGQQEWRENNKDEMLRIAYENGDVQAMNQWRLENPEEHSRRTSEGLKKFYASLTSEEKKQRTIHAKKACSMPVDMYNFETKELVDSAPSMRELATRHNLDRGNIRKVLNGKRNHHKGFYFVVKNI